MKVIHFGIHNKENRNSGDTLLFKETRILFEKYLKTKIDWTLINLWVKVTPELIRRINNEYDFILIGGGGLFLRDQKGAEKSISGWQWNCDTTLINDIVKPIVIFGVGYNRFRRQPDFIPEFNYNIKSLFKKSIFVGLRNSGSIEQVKRYIDFPSHVKFFLQSCPTTMLSNTHNINLVHKPVAKITFNLAYDRPFFRFGNKEEEVLNIISKFLVFVKEKGYQLDICLHKKDDAKIIEFLPPKLNYHLVDLSNANSSEIIDYYKGIDLAIGLRGHSQLIPFGLNKRILSIITHDKLQFFLDDINHPEWGGDVNDDNFENLLYERFKDIVNDNKIYDKLINAQLDIINRTKNNFKYIIKTLKTIK